jgi:hypothetical protein
MLEEWNPNLISGDFLGGTMDLQQLSSVPPGRSTAHHALNYTSAELPLPLVGGVHGMAGYHAATAALADSDC